LAKPGFEFSVVDAGVAAGDDQELGIAAAECDRLRDPRGIDAPSALAASATVAVLAVCSMRTASGALDFKKSRTLSILMRRT
jgi:hypothetical protein